MKATLKILLRKDYKNLEGESSIYWSVTFKRNLEVSCFYFKVEFLIQFKNKNFETFFLSISSV